MTDLGQGKTLLPDTREENEIHPSGVNGVTTDSLAPGLAPGESAAPTLTVSLGGVRRAEAGGRLPRTPPDSASSDRRPERGIRVARRGRCSSCGCGQAGRGGAGPRQSAFGSPAARRVSTAQLRPAQPGCSWRGARCQGQLQEGTQGRPGYSYSSVHNASRDGALQCPPSPLTLPPLETRKVLRTDGAERCRGQTGPALTSDAVPSPFPSRCPRLAHRLQ